MIKPGLRYFLGAMWLINMVFLFGSVTYLFSGEKGQFPPLVLGGIGLFFVFFIYLLRDILKFRRALFIKISGGVFLLSAIFYIYAGNLFMVIPAALSGILVFKNLKKL